MPTTEVEMQRVLVLGIPGAGKSTFAQRMGAVLDLPVYHLDRYYWKPGWEASAPDEWQDKLKALLARDRWILDGNYRSTIPMRLEYADTVTYLDVPRLVALWRVLKRNTKYRNVSRPDMAEGCPEPWGDLEFLRYIWRFHRNVRPQALALLREFESRPGKTVVYLRSSREAEEWLRSIAQRV